LIGDANRNLTIFYFEVYGVNRAWRLSW